MKVNHKADYRARRRAEYPSVEDQLDALWKGDAAAGEMRRRVLEIKAKYPAGKAAGPAKT